MISEIELGWLAGLLEGEGYFGHNNTTVTFSVSMTDEDIIERAANLCGRITGRSYSINEISRFTKINSKWGLQYKFQVNGENARKIMRLIVPLMGKRRRKRIWQLLNGCKPNQIVQKQLPEGFIASLLSKQEAA